MEALSLVPSLSCTAGSDSPSVLLFRGIQYGVITHRTLNTLTQADLERDFRIMRGSSESGVIDYYCDVGFFCDPLRSYFDLLMTESIIACIHDRELEERCDSTIEALIEKEHAYFQSSRSDISVDVWHAPSVHCRLRFLLSLTWQLFAIGKSLDADVATKLIPAAQWLTPVEFEVRNQCVAFVGKTPFESIRRSQVLERKLAKLQIELLMASAHHAHDEM